MEVTELKEKLHSLIENSTAETLEYMYALFDYILKYMQHYSKFFFLNKRKRIIL